MKIETMSTEMLDEIVSTTDDEALQDRVWAELERRDTADIEGWYAAPS